MISVADAARIFLVTNPALPVAAPAPPPTPRGSNSPAPVGSHPPSGPQDSNPLCDTVLRAIRAMAALPSRLEAIVRANRAMAPLLRLETIYPVIRAMPPLLDGARVATAANAARKRTLNSAATNHGRTMTITTTHGKPVTITPSDITAAAVRAIMILTASRSNEMIHVVARGMPTLSAAD